MSRLWYVLTLFAMALIVSMLTGCASGCPDTAKTEREQGRIVVWCSR